MQKEYNITFSINREHLLFACVTLYSLLKNNDKYHFNIYLLHNNCLNKEEIDEICSKHPLNQFNNFKIILIDTSKLEILQQKSSIPSENIKRNHSWPKEILFKLFLHQFLPKVDNILHLDTDIIVKGDISKLFEIEENIIFKGNPLASNVKDNWLNAGVMLMNLKLARELEIEKTIIPYLEKNNALEERVINDLFKNEISFFKEKIILHMDKEEKLRDFSNIVVVHYFSENKPFSCPTKYHSIKLYFEYHSYLKAFIKNKIRYELLILSTFLLNIFYSYKRRYIHFMQKHFNKKIEYKPSFMIEKIYKYAIIKKQ
jgi:lipopolysaccharide biosynthesis glycosyltransferase